VTVEAVSATAGSVAGASGIGSAGGAVVGTATATTAGVTAASVAAKVGLGIGAKLAIGAAALATTAVVTVGVAVVVSDNNETTLPAVTTQLIVEDETTEKDTEEFTTSDKVEQTTEEATSAEDTTEEAVYNDWRTLEGTYSVSYDRPDDTLIISNVRGDFEDLNNITLDVEFRGEKVTNITPTDNIIMFTINREDGSVSEVEFKIWKDFLDNYDHGKLLELKDIVTTPEGNVASLMGTTPYIYSKMMTENMGDILYLPSIKEGEYELFDTVVNGSPEDYIYTFKYSNVMYNNRPFADIVIEIRNEDGEVIDTIAPDGDLMGDSLYYNFWGRTSEGYSFVCRVECYAGSEVLVMNCQPMSDEYLPEWSNGENLRCYLKKN
jgi:hypothetical protein